MRDVRQTVLAVLVETACHAGHLDAVRELLDEEQDRLRMLACSPILLFRRREAGVRVDGAVAAAEDADVDVARVHLFEQGRARRPPRGRKVLGDEGPYIETLALE